MEDWKEKRRLIVAVQSLPGVLTIDYGPGELLFQEGAFAAGVSLVAQGLVICGRYILGESVPTSLAGPGDLLGVEAWLPRGPARYCGYARANSAVRTLFLNTEGWRAGFEQPELRELVLGALATAALDNEMIRGLRGRPDKALAWLLWRWGEPTAGGLRLPAATALLASLIGESKNAIRKALWTLSQEGLVNLEGGSVWAHPEALHTYLFGASLTGSPRG